MKRKSRDFWTGRKVLVTGGAGFIGSHVVELLAGRGAVVTVLDNLSGSKQENIRTVRNKIRVISGDCTDMKTAEAACKGQEVVMNLAAKVGGIGYNRNHQATMLYSNLQIAANMIEAARRTDVDRFLVISSACIYPRDAVVPTPESEGFRGEPESTNGGYGWAKRMAEKLGIYYAEEYGMNVGIVRPYNVYGPRDHFAEKSSHVIPSLISRILSGEDPLNVWGSGRQTRAFLYVTDAAEGMIRAIEKYPVPDPVNLGTDEEISVRQLVTLIRKLTGIGTRAVFDITFPDGSPRRNCDNRKALKTVGFAATTRLEAGLKLTIDWYRKHKMRTGVK